MFLGAGAVNKNQITANSMSDNFVFAELKSTPVGGAMMPMFVLLEISKKSSTLSLTNSLD